MAKNVIIAGGSGFIGRRLSATLIEAGYRVSILTRGKTEKQGDLNYINWSSSNQSFIQDLENAEIIINLAGESIAAGIWTEAKKERLLKSRLDSTRLLVDAVNSSKKKPAMFLQASAIGFYGSRDDEILSEKSSRGTGFLAELVAKWEQEAARLQGAPLAYLRIGLVLGDDGGLLQKLKNVFKMGFGGHIGDGTQYMSWIHIDDIVGIIMHLIHSKKAGIYNLTAPNPVQGRDFFKTLARVLSRPSWLHVPKFMLKLAPGDMGNEIFLASQRIHVDALSSYKFQFSNVDDALKDLI